MNLIPILYETVRAQLELEAGLNDKGRSHFSKSPIWYVNIDRLWIDHMQVELSGNSALNLQLVLYMMM